ncbi:MAG: EAL domain-containing protein, partial [Burkholderiales bacterium]
GRAIRERKPVILRDAGADPSFAPWRKAARDYEFKTTAGFPLVAGGQAIGALNLYSRDPEAFNEDDVGLLRELADDLAYGIHALRGQTDRTRMMTEQEILLDSTAVGIAFIKQRWIVRSNRGYAAMFGYARDEIVGVSTRQLHVSDDAFDAVGIEVPARIAESGHFAGERQYRRRDGSLFWVYYEVTPLDPADLDRGVIWTGYDITKAKQAESALRESEARLRVTLEATRVGIWDWDVRGGVWHANPTYFTMLGHEPDAGPQTRAVWGPRRHPEDRDRVHAAFDAMLGPGRDFELESRVRHADGSYRWMASIGRAVEFDHRGRASRMLGLQIDITERKQAQLALARSEELLRQLAGNIPEAFWVREADSDRILYASPGWQAITGRPPLTSLQDVWQIVHPDDLERVQAEVRAAWAGGVDQEYRFLRADGELRWLRVRSFPIQGTSGDSGRVAVVAEDVTEKKAGEQRLMQLAHYDHLTDLPNRAYFSEALERIIGQARRGGWTVGVLFIDLDRFKGVNDTLGHAAGDELLQQVAGRLLHCVRVRDVVGRLGGDEYALILPALERPEHAGSVAAKILESFARPFEISGRELFVTPSIGITLFPADGAEAGELLRNADAAMYRAKEEGRNTYRYYTAQMNRLAAEKLELEGLLRRALERGELLLHYQPKLDLASGQVSGLEALLRWQRPGVGLVAPGEFIPLLEETGLIVPVGDWVVAEACRQLKAWRAESAPPVPIAVNLSARQFREKDLAERITRAARAHEVAPGGLELEITESALMSNDADVVAALGALRAAGMRIALDDFGTGYSSLSYLKRFPIDAVKIDRSFVSGVQSDPNDAAIALSVIGIGRSLGLRVIAEGVETDAQLEFLRANRCDEIQGYQFARPMDAAATAEFVRRHRALGSRSED